MASASSFQLSIDPLIERIIDILSSTDRPSHYAQTLDAYSALCKGPSENASTLAHKLINNKQFISLILTQFKTFNTQIIAAKETANHPSSYVFHAFPEIAHYNSSILKTEYKIVDCLRLLILLSEINQPKSTYAQIRSIFNRETDSNNLFRTISSILAHCKLYRLRLGNTLFRFLQNMFPPINTSKSKKFCRNFDVSILLDRCCSFLIYRQHIDGDGDINPNKDDYNKMYGITYPLPSYIDSVVSILTYFLSSKWHKALVLVNEDIVKAVSLLCVRLCHEIQSDFDLQKFHGIENLMSRPTEFQRVLNEMGQRFSKNEYFGHRIAITVSMEFLYYYSMERDIGSLELPLGDASGTESFDSCWMDYQYIVALIRWVTQDKILGLYLDTIAEKLGYAAVSVEDEVKDKKKEELMCHQMYSVHKMHCFYAKCNRELVKGKLKKCKGCKVAFYCNARCQKNDWKYHKEICGMKNDEDVSGDDGLIRCYNVGCEERENCRRCTGCYDVYYCSVECQRENWRLHKKECKKKRKERKVQAEKAEMKKEQNRDHDAEYFMYVVSIIVVLILALGLNI